VKKPGNTFFQTYPSFGLVRSVASSRPGFRQTNPSPSANPDPARRITARAAQTSAAALGPAPHPAPLVGALGEEPGGRLRIEYSQFSADRPTEGKGGRLRWPAGRIAAPRENRLNKKAFLGPWRYSTQCPPNTRSTTGPATRSEFRSQIPTTQYRRPRGPAVPRVWATALRREPGAASRRTTLALHPISSGGFLG
jgi:hypothetical protein